MSKFCNRVYKILILLNNTAERILATTFEKIPAQITALSFLNFQSILK